jgi:hypothetical protein
MYIQCTSATDTAVMGQTEKFPIYIYGQCNTVTVQYFQHLYQKPSSQFYANRQQQ